MDRGTLLYEGKAKKLYESAQSDALICEFKDDLTAFNAEKKGSESGKGALNCQISTELFKMLESKGIQTHLIEKLSPTEQLVKKVKIIPIEVVVRNTATGSLTRRLGIEDGKVLPFPLVEFCYKNDDFGDPIITEDHCIIMELIDSREKLSYLKSEAIKINAILKEYFASKDLDLIDFKLEFGIDSDGSIVLSDEISPDSCRFWDTTTKQKLDKDRFRQGLGSVKVAYEEVLRRITGEQI